ncbi:MAG: HEAT repeat domain-containing protein, partial [Pirellulales bacterium]|nr:HEAT repeat domain-containing protein [Pirellulales bacterium]
DCSVVPNTSFAVLLLLRSMKKKWGKAENFSEGIMVGGSGLPENTGHAILNAEGRVVSRPLMGPAERLLAALANPELANIDDSVNLVEELPADKIETLVSKHGDVLRRLVGNKSPKARWAIVKTLGKTRNLDNVEVLIYALTDPIPEVAHAANEALLRIRRNLDAVVLPEKFTEEDRRFAIEKWKTWYRSIRPDAKFEWTESK